MTSHQEPAGQRRTTRTRYYTATTLDGYIATDDHDLGWLFEVDSADEQPFAEFLGDIGAIAMGANTYRWLLRHEDPISDPGRWTQWYGDRPTWVFTSSELPRIPGVPITLTDRDLREVHRDMVDAAAGADIWLVGGGELAAAFFDAGLIDELVLGVAPVLLCTGRPLLPRHVRSANLRLSTVAQVGQFAYLTYQVISPDR